MRDKARVLSINQNATVQVLPILKDTCINCNSGSCAKGVKPFTVSNPFGLPLKPGMTVRIAAKKSRQAVQAFGALCVTIICAVGGWFAADMYIPYFGSRTAESVHAAGVLAGLFIPALIIFIVSKYRHPAYGEVVEIVSDV